MAAPPDASTAGMKCSAMCIVVLLPGMRDCLGFIKNTPSPTISELDHHVAPLAYAAADGNYRLDLRVRRIQLLI